MHEQATLMSYSYTKKLTKNVVNTQIKHFFPSTLGVHGDRMSGKHSCTSCAKCQKTNDVRWYHCSKASQTAMFEIFAEKLTSKDEPLPARLCICQRCNAWVRRQLKRPCDGTSDAPEKPSRQVCNAVNCNEPMHCKYPRTSYEMATQEDLDLPPATQEVALCSKHYRSVYRKENDVTCFSCGKRQMQRALLPPV